MGRNYIETLLSREEMAIADEIDNYYSVKPDMRDLNYSTYVEEGDWEHVRADRLYVPQYEAG